MKPVRIRVEGAQGAHLATVEAALRMLPGVLAVHADPVAREISVEAGESIDPDELIAAAAKVGAVATLVG